MPPKQPPTGQTQVTPPARVNGVEAADPRLAGYIKRRLANGTDIAALKSELQTRGWSEPQLAQAFEQVSTQPAAPTAVQPQPEIINTAPAQSPAGILTLQPIWLDWVFRLGFASIFLVNALVAWFEPEDFISLLEANFIAKHIPFAALMVHFAAINDIVLGGLIVSGKARRVAYIWAALWLLLVAGLKISNLVL